MSKYILEDKDFETEYRVKPEIVKIGDEVNGHYGTDFGVVTDSDIRALQEGKCLYFDINDGEYACIIRKEATEE